jgi:hypothetical protein
MCSHCGQGRVSEHNVIEVALGDWPSFTTCTQPGELYLEALRSAQRLAVSAYDSKELRETAARVLATTGGQACARSRRAVVHDP